MFQVPTSRFCMMCIEPWLTSKLLYVHVLRFEVSPSVAEFKNSPLVSNSANIILHSEGQTSEWSNNKHNAHKHGHVGSPLRQPR